MKNFRQYFVLKFFHEEKFKMQKIFVKSLSDENFSMMKKRQFTVYIYIYICVCVCVCVCVCDLKSNAFFCLFV